MEYLTEHLDEDDKCQTRYFGGDLNKARGFARRLSAKDHNLLVYVVACTDTERVGAEAYACGRRDSADGQMTSS